MNPRDKPAGDGKRVRIGAGARRAEDRAQPEIPIDHVELGLIYELIVKKAARSTSR
jgi:hypothetical protein